MTAAQCFAAQAASPVARVKAKLIAFDGQRMTLEPLAPKQETPDPVAPKAGAPKAGRRWPLPKQV